MTNKRTSMLRGYARRMAEIARLTIEMRDIRTKYEREFGEGIDPDAMTEVLTGDRLAKLLHELRADAPEQPAPVAEDVPEATSDTAPGAALGLAPAPHWLIDKESEEPVKWGAK